jgi:hypothetical protein
MATFAALSGNQVNNIIVANTLEDAELVTGSTCIQYENNNPARIGDIYDGTKFITPVFEPTTESDTDTVE